MQDSPVCPSAASQDLWKGVELGGGGPDPNDPSKSRSRNQKNKSQNFLLICLHQCAKSTLQQAVSLANRFFKKEIN